MSLFGFLQTSPPLCLTFVIFAFHFHRGELDPHGADGNGKHRTAENSNIAFEK